MFANFMLFAASSFASVLLLYPITYIIMKKFVKIKFNYTTIAIGFVISWFISSVPGFLYGDIFYTQNALARLYLPVIISAITLVILNIISKDY